MRWGGGCKGKAALACSSLVRQQKCWLAASNGTSVALSALPLQELLLPVCWLPPRALRPAPLHEASQRGAGRRQAAGAAEAGGVWGVSGALRGGNEGEPRALPLAAHTRTSGLHSHPAQRCNFREPCLSLLEVRAQVAGISAGDFVYCSFANLALGATPYNITLHRRGAPGRCHHVKLAASRLSSPRPCTCGCVAEHPARRSWHYAAPIAWKTY